MTDRNCWKCANNTAINTCAIMEAFWDNEDLAGSVGDWIDSFVVPSGTQMPAKETPTPCPGFTHIPEAV